jgi:hypothetical protein
MSAASWADGFGENSTWRACPAHLRIAAPILPLLLPFLCEPGCVPLSLSARKSSNTNDSHRAFSAGRA